jgi:hypothetical protein
LFDNHEPILSCISYKLQVMETRFPNASWRVNAVDDVSR